VFKFTNSKGEYAYLSHNEIYFVLRDMLFIESDLLPQTNPYQPFVSIMPGGSVFRVVLQPSKINQTQPKVVQHELLFNGPLPGLFDIETIFDIASSNNNDDISVRGQAMYYEPRIVGRGTTISLPNTQSISEDKQPTPTKKLECAFEDDLREEDKLYANNVVHVSKKKECQICFERKKAPLLFHPCNHSRTCVRCTIDIYKEKGECPFCRSVISSVQKIF
jgi:hypothetical protein